MDIHLDETYAEIITRMGSVAHDLVPEDTKRNLTDENIVKFCIAVAFTSCMQNPENPIQIEEIIRESGFVAFTEKGKAMLDAAMKDAKK